MAPALPKRQITQDELKAIDARIKVIESWEKFKADRDAASSTAGRKSSRSIDNVLGRSALGLWAKQSLNAAQDIQWEKVVLTVDSGASDTVLPPSIARLVPLMRTSKVGTEYEVANGAVIYNLGEKK